MPPLLQLSGVTKSFGAVRALKGVSFSLAAGEVHALLGENGAGKSTLIKVITGAHQPDSGTIAVDGETTGKLTPSTARTRGIAAIYQQPALFPDLTVAENIGLGLEKPSPFRPVRWAERRAHARELLQRVGANIDPETEVRNLSMPEQQLVEIARSLGAGARILIMDEPTASLTQKEVQLLLKLVRDLREQGVGIIYISHRLEEIFEVADRVTVLRDGESVGTKSAKEIDEPGLIRMMVGREVSSIYPPSESQPGKPVLRLENVGCSSSGVRGVSFEVRAGEVFGLSGLVGAGRTELARILFGITPADSGKILLKGDSIEIHSPRQAVESGIAYVPEDRRRHGVVLEMPIASNITMAIHPSFFPGSWLRFGKERELAEKYISDLQIKTPSSEAPGGSLSGGNQQKVALSRWLATHPKVLILDEPTQGVDVGAKSEIHKIIRKLAAEGLAVIMISSDLPEVLGMSDRIGVMRGGTLTRILDGPTADAHSVMSAALGQDEAGGIAA
ncbi:MAG: sugar ABC transporter ATP-binding protein [Verrucomicrobia bacterium]|nr:sugar ABC transporter ATP-binding protein [Verrucomicrobiota bacterium]